MTLSFKDSDGVACIEFTDAKGYRVRLACYATPGGFWVHDATLDDLTRALGLSTEGGPTDEELEKLSFVATTRVEGRRFIFTAGSASRQPEVDRLTARVAELESCESTKDLEQRIEEAGWTCVDTGYVEQHEATRAELAATKEKLSALEEQLTREREAWTNAEHLLHAKTGELRRMACKLDETKEKLAEVERERDKWSGLHSKESYRAYQLEEELRRARPVVEAAKAWQSFDEVPEHERIAEFSDAETALSRAVKALSSAGADADRTEAPRKDRTDETEQHGNVRGESTPGVQTDPSVTGARVSTEVLGTVPRDGGPQRAAVSSDTGDSSARSDGFAEGAALSGRNEGLEAFAARHRSERTEPPRPEAGESGPTHTCMFTATTLDGTPPPPCPACQARFAAKPPTESKPEPQPSGEAIRGALLTILGDDMASEEECRGALRLAELLGLPVQPQVQPGQRENP